MDISSLPVITDVKLVKTRQYVSSAGQKTSTWHEAFSPALQNKWTTILQSVSIALKALTGTQQRRVVISAP